MSRIDVLVIGAGAAGLFFAGIAGQRGLRVLVVDHAEAIAEKVRISGGGRCNFTNLDSSPAQFLSENPHFCRSALARFGPTDFTALVRRHGIGFHEKHRGQLFADESSERIIGMLRAECAQGGVEIRHPVTVRGIRQADSGFEVDLDGEPLRPRRLVIATGGLSIPKIGASDFGYRVARQFGHRVVEPRPGLVPLAFTDPGWEAFRGLAGVSLPVRITLAQARNAPDFAEDLLFTHRGLSGPAALQISNYWRPGQGLQVDLAAGEDLGLALREAKASTRRQLDNELARHLPQRLAQVWLNLQGFDATVALPDLRDREIDRLSTSLAGWSPMPTGTEGWRKAEVTVGGVDTRELSSQTLESRRVAGLYFIGEVVDVTGWLGGYNFQWAWASAAACAGAMDRGEG
jgi:predicted Rossmann fold flavoprotein